MNNDTAVSAYVAELDKIYAIADRLMNFVDDHGDLEPDEITTHDAARLRFALSSLRAACEILGIDLAVRP